MINLIKTCAICGKDFEAKETSIATTCSNTCRMKLREQTNLLKYGVTSPNKIPENRERFRKQTLANANKRKQTCLERYGVEYSSQNREIRDRISATVKSNECKEQTLETNRRKFGADHAMQIDSIKSAQLKKAKTTMLEKYGVEHPCQDSSIAHRAISNMQKAMIEKYGTVVPSHVGEINERRIKNIKSTMIDRYGAEYPGQVKELHDKMARNCFNKTADDGTHVDSGYEQLVYNFLLRNELEFEYQIPVNYLYNESKHVSYIDFNVQNRLYEVKGAHLLKGIYDHAKYTVPIEVKLKVYSDHEVVIITDSFMHSLFETSETLQGIAIEIFKETWQNEQTVWKIIQTKLAEGIKFVDCKMIKQGLNKERAAAFLQLLFL